MSQNWSLFVICAVAFVAGLDLTITNVAVPAIGADLDTNTADLQWIVDSYNIAVAGLLLLGAALGERFSRKWTFIAGLVLFTAGTLLAGFSASVAPLIAARSIQGVGAALLLSPALSLIAQIYPPEKRASAVAWWATAGALGIAIGPIAGGLLVDRLSWNWIFFVNVPVLFASILLGIRFLPPGRGTVRARLDIVGAVLSVLGFAFLLGGLIEGPRWSWSPIVLLAVGLGIALVAAFVLWELHQESPLFEVRVLAQREVTAAALALFTSYISFTGILFLVPQHLEGVVRVDVMVTGVSMVPLALVFWIVSRRASWVGERIGTSKALVIGVSLLALGFAVLAISSSTSGLIPVITGTCITAAGLGLTIPLGSVVIINGLPPELTGSAAGTSMFSRFAGAAAGVALLGTALSATYGVLLRPTLQSLGSAVPEGAAGSLQQTLAAAAQLQPADRATLVQAADSAFAAASAIAYLTGLLGSVLTLIACLILLPLRTGRGNARRR